jgi:hypothetical protein
MNKIKVPQGFQKKLLKVFPNITTATVSYALSGKINSDLGQKIRKYALDNGGEIIITNFDQYSISYNMDDNLFFRILLKNEAECLIWYYGAFRTVKLGGNIAKDINGNSYTYIRPRCKEKSILYKTDILAARYKSGFYFMMGIYSFVPSGVRYEQFSRLKSEAINKFLDYESDLNI